MSASHCQLVLDALADGEWHSTASLYRECGGMILHSRIADLRKRGHVIEHRHVGGVGADAHEYRLVEPRGAPLADQDARVEETTAAVTKPLTEAERLASEHGITPEQAQLDLFRYGHVAAWR